MKDNVRPSKAMTRRGEIVEEIVDHLRPWGKRGHPLWGKPNRGHRLSEAMVINNVTRQFDMLLWGYSSRIERDDRRRNRVHARKLDSALAEVQRLAASAPIPLASLLSESANSFVPELKRWRRKCARLIDWKFGQHPNYEVGKHMCAAFAFDLMETLSEKKITSAKDSTFRAIASLLYEAVSGNRGVDLKRACDDVLRESRDV
jgi:hypothetical protein